METKLGEFPVEKGYEYDKDGIRTDSPDWFQRLYKEWDELRERRNKLKAFLDTCEEEGIVSCAQHILLKKQLSVMDEYADILYVRLCLANDEFAIVKDTEPMLKGK